MSCQYVLAFEPYKVSFGDALSCSTSFKFHSQQKVLNFTSSNTMSLEADVQACADNGMNFQNKLADTLRGLLNANNDRKSEIDALRGDHEELKKNHEAFVNTAERENDLRRNEIKSLEERMQKENQVWQKKYYQNR